MASQPLVKVRPKNESNTGKTGSLFFTFLLLLVNSFRPLADHITSMFAQCGYRCFRIVWAGVWLGRRSLLMVKHLTRGRSLLRRIVISYVMGRSLVQSGSGYCTVLMAPICLITKSKCDKGVAQHIRRPLLTLHRIHKID